MTLGTALISSRKLKARLGPPDLYPQDPNQKEDDLNAVHVKQGFTTSYLNLVANDEYGSALNKLKDFPSAKIWNDFKSILVKKEDLNTLQETKDKSRRQPINTRDDFWLVTGRNKPAVEKWLKDLSGSKSLSILAKKVPIFNRREEILMSLCEYDVPISRGVWLIKMTAAYTAAMQESNKSKKRVQVDPSVDWTQSLMKYLSEQRSLLQEIISPSTDRLSALPGALAALEPESKPETSQPYKQLMYVLELCWYMYQQGLLDRGEFLQWLLELVEKCRNPEEPIFRLMMPTMLRYASEFAKSEMLARKLAHQCAKKITFMVQEAEAFTSSSATSTSQEPGGGGGTGPTSAASSTVTTPTKNNGTVPGTNQQLPPVIAALLELQNDQYSRIIIFGLSAIMQTIVMECPSALVWNYFGENKTPSSLLGSPLDHLPNLSPSSLPMPPRANNPDIRQHVRQCEANIKERSNAAESHWATNGSDNTANSTSVVVGKILSVLEELDRFVFDKNDSSNCLDVLYNRVWSGCQSGQGLQPDDEAVVTMLCEWSVTSNRSGEHRAFVAAKLLEQRQTEMLVGEEGDQEKEGGELYLAGPPLFQDLLFKYLDTEAPYQTSPSPSSSSKHELANLVLLFHELLAHDVFSHDAYMCTLISRGDLTSPLQSHQGAGKEGEKMSQSDASFEESKINDDLGALVKQITEGNKLDDPYSPEPSAGAAGGGRDATAVTEVWKYNRHWQYTHHFPIPLPHDESASHDINQRHILLYGSGRGKDECSKQVKKLSKEILKLFGKRFSIDVNDGGKIKKHTKHEFLFSEVIQKFQELSYFDQHVVHT
jgi:mediator of RNA polymerase II transcription subunit 12